MHRLGLAALAVVAIVAAVFVAGGSAGDVADAQEGWNRHLRRRAGAAVPERSARRVQQHLDVVDRGHVASRAVHHQAELLDPARHGRWRGQGLADGPEVHAHRQDQEEGRLERRRAGHREGLRLHDAVLPQPAERGRGPQRLGLDRKRQAVDQGRQVLPRHLHEAVRTVEGAAGHQSSTRSTRCRGRTSTRSGTRTTTTRRRASRWGTVPSSSRTTRRASPSP